MTHKIELPEIPDLAPEPPPRGPRVWLRENLFSTPVSGVLSIVTILVGLAVYRGVLAFIFAPDRRWEAVTYNARLLMIQAYPNEQMTRIWLSVAIVVVLLAASFAVYRIGGQTTPRKVGIGLMSLGSFIVLGGIIGPWGIALSPFGVESMRGFLAWVIMGVVLIVGGQLLRTIPGERAKDPTIPVLGVVLVAIFVVLTVLWTVLLPQPIFDEAGKQTITMEPIAMSTRLPWTYIAVLGLVVYFIMWFLRDRIPVGPARKTLMGLWIASFPVIVLVILRDPDMDYGRVLTWYLPVALGFIVIGGLILNFVAGGRGEIGRVIGAALLILAFASFAFPMEFLIRFLLLSLAMFALAAPTFGGKGAGRVVFLSIWAGWAGLLTFFLALLTAPSTVEVAGSSFLGGLLLTIVLSVVAISLSLPLGIILALARTSKMPIFRLMATTYIEVVRGVPLITWLIVAFIMLPVALPPGVEIGGVARAMGAMTFFSAAYLAENVRGGLQAIPKGQYEASEAMGLTTSQTTVFIVLPQALRAVIPALVGQVIALFKDTYRSSSLPSSTGCSPSRSAASRSGWRRSLVLANGDVKG
jgi:His/Glu/Gln/Arg/opine family amino acid ABC transporter permease subunit